MTEINRLSFVIRTIDKDFTILPVGQLILSHKSKFKTALSITFLPFYTLSILKYTYFSFLFKSI